MPLPPPPDLDAPVVAHVKALAPGGVAMVGGIDAQLMAKLARRKALNGEV